MSLQLYLYTFELPVNLPSLLIVHTCPPVRSTHAEIALHSVSAAGPRNLELLIQLIAPPESQRLRKCTKNSFSVPRLLGNPEFIYRSFFPL